MAAPSKFDNSGSPDRPAYSSALRGSYANALLDRSSSFRESMENQSPSSIASMPRSSSPLVQDVISFFQCLRLDPRSLASDHKLNRQGEIRRIVSVALGFSQDASPSGSSKEKLSSSPSPVEVKKLKAGLGESSTKARQHVRIFNEALSVLNKFFPSIPSRKRSRIDAVSSDRETVLPGNRSGLGPNASKTGTLSHVMPRSLAMEQQRLEERPKSSMISKRTRTALLEPRANSLARSSAQVDKERDMLRPRNSLGEDQKLPIGADDWGKPKTKGKRSGIKSDISRSSLSIKPVEGYQESKQRTQQRLVSGSRAKICNSDGARFASGNGVGVVKSDGILHQTGPGRRSLIARADQDSNSLLSDGKDRNIALDKERVNLKAVNKYTICEDSSLASPTLSTKVVASTCAPRSSGGAMPKPVPSVPRTTANGDLDISRCVNRSPATSGVNSRNRTALVRSPSPPVTNWAGQRPLKMSRTARRKIFLPIDPSTNEAPSVDTLSNVDGNDNGSGLRHTSNASRQLKSRSDLGSATLSDSEESEVADAKSKYKNRICDEVDKKAEHVLQTLPTLLPSSRKNKLIGIKIGDGVRRQGRSGRASAPTRPLMPMPNKKLGKIRTAKQLKPSKMGSDKGESKLVRPPTCKISDRKAYMRNRHSAHLWVAEVIGSDDGQEDMLAAAQAVINPTFSMSNSFWRHMEQIFGFLSKEDIAFLKQQLGDSGKYIYLHSGQEDPTQWKEESISFFPGDAPPLTRMDDCGVAPEGRGVVQHEEGTGLIDGLGNGGLGRHAENFWINKDHNAVTLSQRLIAALISEEEDETDQVDTYGAGLHVEMEPGMGCLTHGSVEKSHSGLHASSDGYKTTASTEYVDSLDVDEGQEPDCHVMAIQNSGTISNFMDCYSGLHQGSEMMPSMASPRCQYENMSINERILMEVQSIGIFPEETDMRQMENDDISEEIMTLVEKHQEEVLKKRDWLDKLLKSALEARKLQEKIYEQHALDKYISLAHEKYMACQTFGLQNTDNEAARQTVLDFVRRALRHCEKYEATGTSCFSEPSFKDIFHVGPTRLTREHMVDGTADGVDHYEQDFSSSRGLHVSCSPKQTTGRKDAWSNKLKTRELSLDGVGGSLSVTSSGSPGVGGSLLNSTKGKRSDREREGKGRGREAFSQQGTAKVGRPVVGSANGERKSKAKPKQKTSQLSASVNGLLGTVSKEPASAVSNSSRTPAKSNEKGKDDCSFDRLNEPPNEPQAMDFSNFEFSGLDAGEGEDLDSWLNVDDNALQDGDFMGLQIPMDDLSEIM